MLLLSVIKAKAIVENKTQSDNDGQTSKCMPVLSQVITREHLTSWRMGQFKTPCKAPRREKQKAKIYVRVLFFTEEEEEEEEVVTIVAVVMGFCGISVSLMPCLM